MEPFAVHLGDDEAAGRDATVLGELLPEVLDGGGGLDAHAKLDLGTQGAWWRLEGGQEKAGRGSEPEQMGDTKMDKRRE